MAEDADHSDVRAVIKATRGSPPPPPEPMLVDSPEPISPEAEAEPEPEVSSALPPSPATPNSLLPAVISVDPAMFIPLDFDITAPLEAPRSRVERAQSMLQTLDFYHTGGRRGMLHLADMDRRRILAQAAGQTTGQTTGQTDTGRPDERAELERELDSMIQNMIAPCQPAEQMYNMTDAELAQYTAPPPAGGTTRRDTALQLQQLVEKVLVQIHGYDGHMNALRARWTAELQKEQRLLAEQSGSGETAGSTESAAATPTTNANTLGTDNEAVR